MASESVTKAKFSPEVTELQFDEGVRPARRAHFLDTARLGLTVLSLLLGIVIIGTSADALIIFNRTYDDTFALWPPSLSVGPNLAIAASGVIIVLSSTVAIIASRIGFIRNRPLIYTILSILGAGVSLLVALIATIIFYARNASDTIDTLQSWSCRWADVDMDSEPHFGKLCHETKVALYMTVIMIPLQVIVIGLGIVATISRKKDAAMRQRKGSPDLS